MNKIITSLLLATACLLSGCNNDDDTINRNEMIGDLVAIQIPVGGIADMVAPSFDTRGFGNDTVRFTEQLNDSLILESMLTPTTSAATRAVGDLISTTLTENAKVLMVAYRGSTLYKYQKLTLTRTSGVNDPFTIYLPAGESFTLVFYSLNSTADINVSKYLNETGTEVDPDGNGANGALYGWLLSSNAAWNTDVTESGGNNTTNGVDAMYAKVVTPVVDEDASLGDVIFHHLFTRLTWKITSLTSDDVTGCTASFGPTCANAKVYMNQLHTEEDLTYLWDDAVSPTVYTNKTLIPFGNLSTNTLNPVKSQPCVFIPTDATSSTSSKLAITLSSLSMGGNVVLTGKTLNLTGVTNALQPGTSYQLESTVNHIPSITIRLRGDGKAGDTEAAAGATVGGRISIYGKKLAADVPATVIPSLNSPFWLSGWYQIDKNGATTKVVSTALSGSTTPNAYLDPADNKKLIINAIDASNDGCTYEARIVAWAGSNIYWNGSILTFDGVPSGGYNDTKQGVFFQWGSLIGISPAQSTPGSNPLTTDLTPNHYTSSTTLYVPNNVSARTWSPTTGVTYPYWSKLDNGAGTDNFIPSFMEDTISLSGDYCAVPYLADVSEAQTNNDLYNAKKGDICKYLLDGWRMPTSYEFDTQNAASIGVLPFGEWDKVDGGSWPYHGDNSLGNASGTATISSCVKQTPTSGGYSGSIFFPATGYRIYGGELQAVGWVGYCWSGSASSDPNTAYLMSFIPTASSYQSSYSTFYMILAYNNSRHSAFPVRCIREY